MGQRNPANSGFPPEFYSLGNSSFFDFLKVAAPEMLPGNREVPPGVGDLVPHGTTIVAAAYDGGVVMGGDRRATMGNLIAQRDTEKVFAADDYSLVGYAGTAGFGTEIVRLFQVELEHYEKIEGTLLTLEGKANQLTRMIRGNLGAAMQGLAVLPIFAGYDLDVTDPARAGRIFAYDVTGGRYEERGYHAVGSGSLFAKGSLKKLWRSGSSRDDVIRVVVDSLYDAADEDTATGGPDPTRKLYPLVFTASAEGALRVPEEEITAVAEAVIAERTDNP